MAHLEDRGASGRLRWRVRWRDPDGRHRSRSFARKADAERFQAGLAVDLYAGTYVDPSAGRVTVADVAVPYLERVDATRKPKTAATYRGLWRTIVEPAWAPVPVARIRHSDVAGWIAHLSTRYSPSRTRQAYGLLASILDVAVADRRIAVNPARGVDLPRMPIRRAYPVLDHGQVVALADAAGRIGGPADRALVLVLAYTGLRWGEAIALGWDDVDLDRRSLVVRRAIVDVDGRLTPTTPKSHQTRRVPLTATTAAALAALPDTPGLVFPGPHGAPVRSSTWRRRVLDPAARAAGLDGITPHGLRHTAASLAVASGASVKAVARMLGHASSAYTMTLDVYADLHDADLDDVATRLEAAARGRLGDAGTGDAPGRAGTARAADLRERPVGAGHGTAGPGS